MEICSRFTGMERKDGAFLLHTDNADIKVCFVTDEIVRVRASFDHELAEESYVLMTTAWEDRMDALFKGERTRVEPFAAQVTEDDSTLTFATGKVTLVVDKDPINFKLLAADGSELYSTLPGNPFVKDSNNRVVAYSRMKEDDCFYGFGEKTGLLDKNKTFQRERATDAMGYDAEKMDTLYKHIPFYIRLDRDTHKAVGVFYHNFYESVFNMGCEKSNYWPRYTYFQADGGDLDCFLIGGDTIARIVDNYTLLTGRPALLPKRALGYQGSSMYYPELEKDSDDAVLGFIDTIKEEGFPIDGFHLSSGYTSQNNKRCVFTWNTDRFKDPSAYFHAMNEKHAQNVPNVKPGVLLCNPRFDEFNADDVFVKDSKNPETYGVGKWWGGDGAFWDFTKPEGRAAWKKYLTESIIAVGTDSVWNDNCEYDSLMDKDCTCDFDGKGGTIGQLKPLMSTLMCKVGADAVVEHNAKARPYMVCRSGSAGIQRYAQTWCGDNYTSWKSLKYNIPIITGMGLSGQPNPRRRASCSCAGCRTASSRPASPSTLPPTITPSPSRGCSGSLRTPSGTPSCCVTALLPIFTAPSTRPARPVRPSCALWSTTSRTTPRHGRRASSSCSAGIFWWPTFWKRVPRPAPSICPQAASGTTGTISSAATRAARPSRCRSPWLPSPCSSARAQSLPWQTTS